MHTGQGQVSLVGLALMCQRHDVIHRMAIGTVSLMHTAVFTTSVSSLEDERAQGCGNVYTGHSLSNYSMIPAEVRFQQDEHMIDLGKSVQVIAILLGEGSFPIHIEKILQAVLSFIRNLEIYNLINGWLATQKREHFVPGGSPA